MSEDDGLALEREVTERLRAAGWNVSLPRLNGREQVQPDFVVTRPGQMAWVEIKRRPLVSGETASAVARRAEELDYGYLLFVEGSRRGLLLSERLVERQRPVSVALATGASRARELQLDRPEMALIAAYRVVEDAALLLSRRTGARVIGTRSSDVAQALEILGLLSKEDAAIIRLAGETLTRLSLREIVLEGDELNDLEFTAGDRELLEDMISLAEILAQVTADTDAG